MTVREWGVRSAVMNRRSPALEIVAATAAATGALALLSRLEIVSNASLRIDVAVVVVFLASFYFLVRDWRLGFGVLGAAIVIYVAGVVLPLWLAVTALVAGVVLLLISYTVKRP